MERHVEKVDESHDRMFFRMESTGERDKWMRTFPDPIPATHRLMHRWHVHPKTGMSALVIEMVPVGQTGPGAEEPSAAVGPAVNDAAVAERDVLHAKLKVMNDADLETYAAERGVSWGKKATRAQRVAMVLDKMCQFAEVSDGR
jgi:hypothetical protein